MFRALVACVPLERPLGVAVRDAAVARLCDAERIRVSRKVRLEDAVRGASGVFLLRTCAGLSLGATVPRSHRGRPLLRKVAPLQDANVSHHGDWAVCASTNGSTARIGVDVVDLRLLPLRSSLPAFARYLSSGESTRLDPMSDGPAFEVSFGLVWTLKEAFVKVSAAACCGMLPMSWLKDRLSRLLSAPPSLLQAIGRGLTSRLAGVEFQVPPADGDPTCPGAVISPVEAEAAWATAERLTAVAPASKLESTPSPAPDGNLFAAPLKPFLQPRAVDLRSGRRLDNWCVILVRQLVLCDHKLHHLEYQQNVPIAAALLFICSFSSSSFVTPLLPSLQALRVRAHRRVAPCIVRHLGAAGAQ